MNRWQHETCNVKETLALGAAVGEHLQPGTVVALNGMLGSGKTHFVKGIACGAGVPGDVVVNSPTFVLINEYPGRHPLFHIDVYRLTGPAELEALGIDEMLTDGGCLVIEWANKVESLLPQDHLSVTIEVSAETHRVFTFCAEGEDARRLLTSIHRCFDQNDGAGRRNDG